MILGRKNLKSELQFGRKNLKTAYTLGKKLIKFNDIKYELEKLTKLDENPKSYLEKR